MNLLRPTFRLVAAMILSLAMIRPGLASNFNVKPVRVEFSKAKMNSVIQIANLEDVTLTVQASTLSWTSDGDKSVYTAVDDVLLNPPVFQIPANGMQYMRLGLRKVPDDAAEHAYRLILAEVPKPMAPGFTGLRTVVRISLPIFVTPPTCIAKLSWEARRGEDGVLTLTAINQGTAHIQIKNLELSADQQGKPVSQSFNEYLLPGQKHDWKIEDPTLRGAHEIQLTAKTDAEESHAHVVVQH
ncbi:MAG TPA: fimbria/pilus periplasmic chaperone [Terriglobales bacterium]|jgi:fimbrial chaperone protein|nr:fimbria/pilus periplasmic chaperone [Terriglobales bacterium]